ncbi:solute carrier family 28 member 3-like [Brachionus plicatilis]|uniref:Solute carrier family 28 member 3-like n=1 Tax=Brachionus plicatilis TaxID=10195 RepID=A0A3M7SVF4_BRAPC|nr:solute carrier family 28 member 3-like [Brachionus plicatilis]
MSHKNTSEIFSVMTSGFATVAGSVLAAYINFNIPANHLIIASLMAAPAALTISKTIHPETKNTRANWHAIKNLPKGDARNIFEAISIGASNMVGPIGGILSNLIAFTACFAFIDAFCIWIFSMIGLENFGVTSIMSYLFYPFAFLMGVSLTDAKSVSKLIGIKMFVNEFAAFDELGKAIRFRDSIIASGEFDAYKNGTYPLPNDIYMVWEDRSILISTYALCGFANFASMGIAIGGLGALAPKRLKTFSKFALKAMIAGNITNFCTACIAGLLFDKLNISLSVSHFITTLCSSWSACDQVFRLVPTASKNEEIGFFYNRILFNENYKVIRVFLFNFSQNNFKDREIQKNRTDIIIIDKYSNRIYLIS